PTDPADPGTLSTTAGRCSPKRGTLKADCSAIVADARPNPRACPCPSPGHTVPGAHVSCGALSCHSLRRAPLGGGTPFATDCPGSPRRAPSFPGRDLEDESASGRSPGAASGTRHSDDRLCPPLHRLRPRPPRPAGLGD